MKKLFLSLATVIVVANVFILKVQAADLLPGPIKNLFNLMGTDGCNTAGFITNRVQTGLVIGLIVLVLFGVVYSLLAAFKYIRSEGDPGKIEEAQKGIKAIFFGIAAMMIGIVGIVIVFVFFGATRPGTNVYQVCLSAPESIACQECNAGGGTKCDACELLWTNWCKDTKKATDPKSDPNCKNPVAGAGGQQGQQGQQASCLLTCVTQNNYIGDTICSTLNLGNTATYTCSPGSDLTRKLICDKNKKCVSFN
ncbi:MAG: hypothetical protein WCJ58_02810 [bacterium]